MINGYTLICQPLRMNFCLAGLTCGCSELRPFLADLFLTFGEVYDPLVLVCWFFYAPFV